MPVRRVSSAAPPSIRKVEGELNGTEDGGEEVGMGTVVGGRDRETLVYQGSVRSGQQVSDWVQDVKFGVRGLGMDGWPF